VQLLECSPFHQESDFAAHMPVILSALWSMSWSGLGVGELVSKFRHEDPVISFIALSLCIIPLFSIAS